MNVELRTTVTATHVRQLLDMYRNEWWTADRELADVETMIEFSDYVFAYVDTEGDLVAFARVLTDRVFKAFLFDVIVRPQYRGGGLGARIIRDVTTHPVLSKVHGIELYCRPELEDFYRSFGFSSDTGGIVLMRRPGAAPRDCDARLLIEGGT